MSDYEHQRGRIIKVVSEEGITLHQHCLNILEEKGIKYDENYKYYDNPEEQVGDELYEKYVILQGELYEYLELVDEDPYESFAHVEEGDNGEIRFHSRYYNGGTCLSEMLDEALGKLNKDNEAIRNS